MNDFPKRQIPAKGVHVDPDQPIRLRRCDGVWYGPNSPRKCKDVVLRVHSPDPTKRQRVHYYLETESRHTPSRALGWAQPVSPLADGSD